MDKYDVIVIGGGPAGLQAALTLGRVHRHTLVLDSGRYRNARADHLHNFLTRDGTPPGDLLALARKELAAYPSVAVRDLTVERVAREGAGFTVTAGGETLHARGLVLATGLRDTLPDKPGLAELFGTTVAHCPFCHGHEYAGRPVAILGAGPRVDHLVGIMRPVASRLIVLADGAEPEVDLPDGVALRREPVTGLRRSPLGATVSFVDGPDEDVAGVLVTTALTQAAPFAEQLGLTLLPSGCVEVDAMGRTSTPGVHAAGDLAHVAALPMPMSSVLAAAAAGQLAGAAMVAHLLAPTALPVPVGRGS